VRYTVFTNESGGILDDLMVARAKDGLRLVVNAARKEHDIAHLSRHLEGTLDVVPEPDRALLALQGPAAVDVLAGCADLVFMSWREVEVCGLPVRVSRSGYTGEDGFELSVAEDDAEALAARLLAHDAVAWTGLGARDSLRLEAGLCLYGHDIDETTTPIEAGLRWTVAKRRRQERNFPGAARILDQPPARRRVGLRPEDRVIARADTAVLDADGAAVGRVTSGGFGPTLGGPLAMGYLPVALAKPDTPVAFDIRGKVRPGRVAGLPFVPHNYFRM
jgi:aminomethyltransferase